jgi:hypothetical protein
MTEAHNNQWLFSQIQYYIQGMLELNEADKRELESREQEIKSTINRFKDKFLTTIGLATTIFLGLASLNILEETMIILIMAVVIVGIISYVILSYSLRNVQFTYSLVTYTC